MRATFTLGDGGGGLLRCEHGTTDTDDVVAAFTRDEIFNRLVAARVELPPQTSNVICSLVAERSLLGILHSQRFGCSYGVLPLRLDALVREAREGPAH